MRSPTEMAPHFDLYDDDIQSDIYAVYDAIREAQGGIARSDRRGGYWVSLGYEETYGMSHDWRNFSSAVYGDALTIFPDTSPVRLPPIQYDPPVQQAWRRLLNPYFTPARINGLESSSRATADRLIDAFIETGRADLATDLANPLPGMVFFEHLVHVPPEDLGTIRHWVDVSQFQAQRNAGAAEQANVSLAAYLSALLERRRSEPPQDDLIDALLSAVIDGRSLSVEEVLPALMLLVMAGLETTSGALSNSLHYLAEHSDDRARLLAQPSAIPLACEEFLRFHGSLQGVPRVVTRGVEVCGRQLEEGDMVLLSYAGANRDPAEFVDADECVIDRQPNRHLAFGVGPHRCIGSHLARLNIRVALEQVLVRVPDFRLRSDAFVSSQGAVTRTYTALPVEFTPGARIH